MSLPSEAELKVRLRVIAASTDEDQKSLAEAVDVKYPTFKSYFSAGKPGPPIGVVLAVAHHTGVPREFVLDGWEAVPEGGGSYAVPEVVKLLAEMQAQLDDLVSRAEADGGSATPPATGEQPGRTSSTPGRGAAARVERVLPPDPLLASSRGKSAAPRSRPGAKTDADSKTAPGPGRSSRKSA